MELTTNRLLERKMNIASIIISVLVLALVILMRQVKLNVGINFNFLPPFHALLNTLASIALLFALYFIRSKNINAHQKAIYTALGLSALFLLSYVVYHFTTEETKYCMEGNIRYVYFFFLITHVVLAAVILPFILLTYTRAYTGQVTRHKRMARWVYPLWLYVTITGPVCYLMLKPCY